MRDVKKNNDELYRKTVAAKSDAVLRVIGQRILELREAEIEQNEAESKGFVIPQETHEKVLQMIKSEKKAALRTNTKIRLRKFAKVCAMVFLVLGVVGMTLVNNVEAFKYHFDNLWVEVKTEYLGLSPNDDNSDSGTEEKEQLKGLWYPKYLPEGFEFSSVKDIGGINRIIFTESEGHFVEISEIKAAGTKLYLDNEAEESGRVEINEKYEGYWAKNDGKTVLAWLQSDQIMEVSAELELTELVKIAESMSIQK
ncbi:DUF4367 domain-containing protein [Aminipila sp.]|uniref:DUF4367 domain-containing protein n=1 Tax=Aminipila sp. TaxID=2060095 RepID=UPI00289A8DEC|nr:DUF4367 domain-containing protein [Aminipila sp.]